MKTVASLQRDEEESSDSSDDEGQAFYAGGSETRLCIIFLLQLLSSIELYLLFILPFICFVYYNSVILSKYLSSCSFEAWLQHEMHF